MSFNEITYTIRGCIFTIYNHFGPGLLESVYQKALAYELIKAGLDVKMEVPISVIYDNNKLDLGFGIDLLVNDCILIELKSVERLAEMHHKQVLTYLKLTGIKLGLLVNFNTDNIAKSIFRKANGL